MLGEVKIDGWRCLYFRGIDGQPRLWSRNGMPLEGADHILHRLRLIEEAAGEAIMLDGEIQVDGTLAATKSWFERGWKRGGEAGVLHLFDAMPLSAWRAGGWERPLLERKEWLRTIVGAVNEPWDWRPRSAGRDDLECVQVMADTWIFGEAHAIEEAQSVWAAGGEGIVLKDPASPYQRLRCDAWLKCKQENMSKWLGRTATWTNSNLRHLPLPERHYGG